MEHGNPTGGTGGLLVIVSDKLTGEGVFSSVGSSGTAGSGSDLTAGGGSSGGGSVNVFWKTENAFSGSSNVAGGQANNRGGARW